MNKKVYFYTDSLFADYIREEKESMKRKHGIDLSTADITAILHKNVIQPNQIRITDTIKPIDINLKWKKLRLKF